MHKYGVESTSTTREAYTLGNLNGNEHWRKSIIKEMKNVSIEFKILEEGKKTSLRHSYMPCNMIFDAEIVSLGNPAMLI